MKLHLSGVDPSGNRVQEESEAFIWTQSRGVYTSRTVFAQIDRIRVEGLASVYRVNAKTMDTTGFDLNGLLPLWTVSIAQERAAALVKHVTNPAEFWRSNGTLMFSAQDPYYDPAKTEGSVGVWAYWLTLIGEGLIEHGSLAEATDLLKRLLTAQTNVLRSAKAFYEFYNADEPRGLGERGSTLGLVPLHLLLRVLGVRIISKTRVWTGRRICVGQPCFGDAVRRHRAPLKRGDRDSLSVRRYGKFALGHSLERSQQQKTMIAPDTLVNEFIFRRSSNGILIASAAGEIEQINPAAAGLLGVAVADVLGRPPEHAFSTNPNLINLFIRPGDQVLDVRLPRRRLAAGIATTLADGRRVVLLQDVTEQRELDARRDAFIATMAHDLRNPVGAMVGYADLISSSGDLNEDQTHFLERMRQTATKLHDVAAELVDLAWVEAGMPLKHVPIELKQPIERVIKQLTPMAEEKQITIVVSVQDPLPLVMGDPDRILMVIHNLLHNAILYSDNEQIVIIHAWGDEQEAYCSVADRGIGITDDELEMVFDRLYRSRDERVQRLPGGGLGLTIARRIINRHGGDIWASSNPGKGSTFTFRLPAVNA